MRLADEMFAQSVQA